MTRRYRIRCGEAIHAVELDDEGHLHFHAHPAAFAELDSERAFAVLSGKAATEGTGCLRLALLVRQGRLSTAVTGADDSRQVLAAVRGIRLARRLRRRA
jgi:hypothetical protein